MQSRVMRVAGTIVAAALLIGGLVPPALASELSTLRPRTDLMLAPTDVPTGYQRTTQSVSSEAGAYELETFVRTGDGAGPRMVLNATMQFNTRLSDADIAETGAGFVTGLRSSMKPGGGFSEPEYLDASDLGELARLMVVKIEPQGERTLEMVAAIFSRGDVLSIVAVSGDDGRTVSQARHFARLLDARIAALSTTAAR